MGVLPNSQFGDVAVIDLPSSVSKVQVKKKLEKEKFQKNKQHYKKKD